MSNYIHIGKRVISPGQPVYIVAELSANHNQDFDQAVKLIHAAKEAGVDAVKVQTYTADTMTLKSDKELFKIKEGTPWSGRTPLQGVPSFILKSSLSDFKVIVSAV